MENTNEFLNHGIGTKNESSLHAILKRWYAKEGDKLEAKVDGYIIDIVRGNQLIEIQTKNFGAIKEKLKKLLLNYKVKLIYPIAEKKIIVTDKKGEITRRKSPKKGNLLDVFDELVSIGDLILNKNLSIEVILLNMEEIRVDDGKGSYRRKGISIVDRTSIEMVCRYEFNNIDDYLALIPKEIGQVFTNKQLSKFAGIKINNARKLTYCFNKASILCISGKLGRENLYEIL